MNVLRRIEILTWCVGVALLVTYASTRAWYAHSRDRGVAMFAAATVEAAMVPPRTADPVDMSTWSRVRVDRYRESLREGVAPLALLRIPAVKLVVPVFEGTSELNLNRGAGSIEGTARIGEAGNVGIAAHRDGFFRVLKDVRVGDTLLLEHLTATDAYRVVSTTIVDPSEVSVLAPTTIHSVTLVTCYPFYYVGSAPRRFIVRAQQVTRAGKEAPAGRTPAGATSRAATGGGAF
jgi:LPXTG-site transpeptidase (sortase) family protein